MMTEQRQTRRHTTAIERDHDGWWGASCLCGFEVEGIPDADTAADVVGDHRVEMALASLAPAIDADHLERQRRWSEATFGPGTRLDGVVDHIRKELDEVLTDDVEPSTEWFDVIILGLDGAWRSGWSPQQIIDGLIGKQERNEGRVWPDWRHADPNKAIEHDRSHDDEEVSSDG